MTKISMDNVLEFLNAMVSGFSTFLDILNRPFTRIVGDIIDYFGPDSFIATLIEVLFGEISATTGNLTLFEFLFGAGLTLLVGFLLFKFVLDIIPVV